MYFLHIVAHLIALLHAKCVLVCRKQINVFPDALEVESHVILYLMHVQRSVKVHDYNLAESSLGLNTGLDIVDSTPLWVRLRCAEELH